MTDPNGGSSRNPGRARQVYVVDDNEEMCRSLEALLTATGYHLRYFTQPSEFLRQHNSLLPGVLLVDLRMPDMNGLDLLAAVMTQTGRFRVVMVTGHGEISTAVQSIKMGAADFLQKPFRESELLEIIDRELALLDHGPADVMPAKSLVSLSPRERDVVTALARGMPNKAIAKKLGISVRTVEMHRSRAMQRLGCRNLADLLRLVFQTSQ